MEQESNDLFDVKLDETGKMYIQKLYKLSGIILVVVAVITLVTGIVQIHRIIKYETLDVKGAMPYLIIKVYPYLTFGSMVFSLIVISYYLKFAKTLSSSVNEQDRYKFNQSFKILYRNITLNLVSLVITLLLNVIILVGEFKMYL